MINVLFQEVLLFPAMKPEQASTSEQNGTAVEGAIGDAKGK